MSIHGLCSLRCILQVAFWTGPGLLWAIREAAAAPGVLAAPGAAAAGVTGADRGGVVEDIAAAGAATSLIAPAQALHRLELCLRAETTFTHLNSGLLQLACSAMHHLILPLLGFSLPALGILDAPPMGG